MNICRPMLRSGASAALVTGVILAVASSAFATLPDNRAYEMVSPIEKGSLSFLPNLALPDTDGEHVIVSGGSRNALLSSGVSWMRETRTPAGWSGAQIGPPPTAEANADEQTEVSLNAVSDDFSSFAFQTRMALDPRDSTRGMGEYVRNGPTGSFIWMTGPPAPNVPVSEPAECNGGLEMAFCATNRAVFAGASTNLQDVVWGQYHPLMAPPASLAGYPTDTHEHGYEVYESVGGTDELVGLVPAGEGVECGGSHGSCVVPSCGAAMGNEGGELNSFGGPTAFGFAPVAGAVSGDGSQVIFTSPDPVAYHEPSTGCAPPEIYVREAGTNSVQASASQKAGGDPRGPKEKLYAGSSEESGRVNTVFFSSKENLTEDANTGNTDEGNDLYAYSIATKKLTDLTPENNTPGPPNQEKEEEGKVEVGLIGSSTNGKLVYFTASSELTAEANSQGQTARPGLSNLYVYEASTEHTRFIASGNGLAPQHTGLRYGIAPEGRLTSEVTPDGQHVVFTSRELLTEYNNFGPECVGARNNETGHPERSPGQCSEVYVYSSASGSLACVSCNPSAAPPTGSARLPERFVEGYFDGSMEPGTFPAPRAISDDGSRVFFSSPDRLTVEAPAPTTTRGPQAPIALNWEYEPNVYEYEAGTVHLIAPAAVLLTSTPSGDDVFFDTYSKVTPQDTDGSPDVYDARVDGGFPVVAPPTCLGSACQGTPAAPTIFATPPSTTFTGVGNVFPSSPSLTVKPTRAQRLAKALKICRSKYPHKKRSRTSCERSAEKQYGAVIKKVTHGKAKAKATHGKGRV